MLEVLKNEFNNHITQSYLQLGLDSTG